MNKTTLKIDRINHNHKIFFDAESIIKIENEFGYRVRFHYNTKSKELSLSNIGSSFTINIYSYPDLVEIRNIKIDNILDES